MKKFIMICLAAGFVNFVSAQAAFGKGKEQYSNKHEHVKEVKQKNKSFNKKEHAISAREFNEKIRQKDWYYEQKIRDAKTNRHLSVSEKYRLVYALQKQREHEKNRLENYYAVNRNMHYDNHQSNRY